MQQGDLKNHFLASVGADAHGAIYPVHKSSIEVINAVAAKSIYDERVPDRKVGDFERPLTWNEERNVYVGFLSDWDGDCRMRLMYGLMKRGFREVMFEADYHWKLSNGIIEISYVEGDLYGVIVGTRNPEVGV